MTRLHATSCLAGLALMLGASLASAAEFPERPLTLIVPVAAGGTMDIAGRALAKYMEEELGQPMIVENRAGGSGNIANALVARAKPDGYTLLFSYEGFHTGNPALFKDMTWDPVESFTPIGEVFRGPHVVLVPRDSPAQDLQAFIELAKQQPGRLNYGSSGNGSIQHLGAEQFKILTQTDIVHVPYNGAAPALQDLMGGRVQLFITTPPTAIGHIQSGNVRALAITSGQRHPMLPEVPTTAEAGLPDFTLEAWFSLFGPADMPEDVVQRLSGALQKVVESEPFKEQMNKLGSYASYQPPAELARIVEQDLARWSQVVRTAGITGN